MSRLEKATHVCLITLCCVATFFLIQAKVSGRARPGADVGARYVGKTLNLPGAQWSGSRLNAVLVLSSTCKFCRASAPLYRQIVSIRNERHGDLSLTAVAQEPLESLRAYIAEDGFAVDNVYQADLHAQGLGGTPTVLLVDRRGVIREAFLGHLNETHEKKLIESLRSAHY